MSIASFDISLHSRFFRTVDPVTLVSTTDLSNPRTRRARSQEAAPA
jgi:hypothetical protein